MLPRLAIKWIWDVTGEKCWFIFGSGKGAAGTGGQGEQTSSALGQRGKHSHSLRLSALGCRQCLPLHGCNRWGKPSWLRLDTSAGLENEVVFIFPCLGFPVYPVLPIYHPLSRGALKPLNVVLSRLGKSWLCTLVSVGLLLMGDSPETSLMPARVLNSGQSQTTYLEGDNVLGWLNE